MAVLTMAILTMARVHDAGLLTTLLLATGQDYPKSLGPEAVVGFSSVSDAVRSRVRVRFRVRVRVGVGVGVRLSLVSE